ncbi:MAG: hypothetical protein K8L99_19460, partial [Anaerolineae bacterium]|nr:hypothetical protein [Anaerolineae bacterium]
PPPKLMRTGARAISGKMLLLVEVDCRIQFVFFIINPITMLAGQKLSKIHAISCEIREGQIRRCN